MTYVCCTNYTLSTLYDETTGQHSVYIDRIYLFTCAATRTGKPATLIKAIDAEAQNFITKGIEGGNAEIKLSELALKQSKNDAIIDYAKMMIAEHTDAGKELKNIAADQSASVPDTLTKAHNQAIEVLTKKTGNAFDKDYIQAMVEDHEQTIALFKTVTGNPNKKITDFADKTLPKLKEHLKKANEICLDLK
jgi:putative membrane protein